MVAGSYRQRFAAASANWRRMFGPSIERTFTTRPWASTVIVTVTMPPTLARRNWLGYSGTARLNKRGSVRCTATEGATAGGSGRAPPGTAPPTVIGAAGDAALGVDVVIDSVTEEATVAVGCGGLTVSVLPGGGSGKRAASGAGAGSSGVGAIGEVSPRVGAGAGSRASAGGAEALRTGALLIDVALEIRGRPAGGACAARRAVAGDPIAAPVEMIAGGTPEPGTVADVGSAAVAAATAADGVDRTARSLFALCQANTPKVMPAKAMTGRSETRDIGQRRTSALKCISALKRPIAIGAATVGAGVRDAVASSRRRSSANSVSSSCRQGTMASSESSGGSIGCDCSTRSSGTPSRASSPRIAAIKALRICRFRKEFARSIRKFWHGLGALLIRPVPSRLRQFGLLFNLVQPHVDRFEVRLETAICGNRFA